MHCFIILARISMIFRAIAQQQQQLQVCTTVYCMVTAIFTLLLAFHKVYEPNDTTMYFSGYVFEGN